MVEAHTVTAEDLRQRKDHWLEADSLTGLTTFDDGSVQLEGGLATVIEKATGADQITDMDRVTPFAVARIDWAGTEDPDFEIREITAHLHPKRSVGSAKEVAWWCIELKAVEWGNDFNDPLLPSARLVDLVDPLYVQAVGTSAADVSFPFAALPRRPRPKSIVPDFANAAGGYARAPRTYVLISALKADGSAAGNVAWTKDNAVASVTTSGNVLSGYLLRRSTSQPGYWLQDGTTTFTPRLAIKSGTYSDATLTFSTDPGNVLDLLATPTADVEFRAHALTPDGTEAVFEVRNDADSAWVAFTTGQLNTELTGVGKNQTYKVRCRLLTNAGGTATPTLVAMGVREVDRVDLRDDAELVAARWGFDPVSLKGEIPTATIVLTRHGERDFQDPATRLLAEHDIGRLLFRTWWGAVDLARTDWLHLDDWLVDGHSPQGTQIIVRCVSALGVLRQQLPAYTLETPAPPNADQANPGSWDDQDAGTTDLYQVVDESLVDDTDYVRSPADPAAAAIELALTNITDPLSSSHHRVEYRYSKDAAAGRTIQLTVELRQGAVVKASTVLAGIAETWVTGSFDLTATEADSITDYSDLRLRFTAQVSGAGAARRARVSWARLTILGHRQALTYANQTLKNVFDDLIGVQARDLEPQYRGPGLEGTDLVSKTIENSDIKAELDALCFIGDAALISSQGRIKAVSVGDQAIVEIFPGEEIEVLGANPGLEQRIPEVFLRYDYEPAEDRYRKESRGFNANALTKLGLARIDPPQFISDEVGKWVPDDETLANGLTQRQASRLGAGVLLWRWKALHARPHLEPGDLVAVRTDQFVARAPNSAQELKGQLWARAVISTVENPEGTEFTGWIRSYDDILTAGEAARRLGFATPGVLDVQLSIADTGAVAIVVKTKDAASVRIATSTSAFPTVATTQAAAAVAVDGEGNYANAAIATATNGQTIYVSVLACETVDGQGAASDLAQARIPYWYQATLSIVTAYGLFRGNRLLIDWLGASGVLSVKVATSTSSFPAAGTGTAQNGGFGVFDAGTGFAYADTVYITVTPYSATGGTGTQGPAYNRMERFSAEPDQGDETTGRRRRAAPYDDGGYALRANDAAGKEATDDLWVLSTKMLKVGSVASPASLTKVPARLNYSDLIPNNDGTLWDIATGYIANNSAGVSELFNGSFKFAAGVTITQVALRSFRQNVTDVASATLYRVGDSGSRTSVATFIWAAGTGYATFTASISELVGTAGYELEIELNGAAAGDARFVWYEVTYTMPSYDKGL